MAAQGPSAAVMLLLAVVLAMSAPHAQADMGKAAPSRQLQQLDQCPAGCTTAGCGLSSTSGGYYCSQCQGTLLVRAEDGVCVCPAGKYGQDNSCIDCPKGQWCAGGVFTGGNTPANITCPADMTTTGKRATSIRQCGECVCVCIHWWCLLMLLLDLC